jgi:beta-galactosidase
MRKIDFNKGWTCKCLTREEAEYPVTLPHDAMIGEPRSEESRGEGNIGWFIGGDYEYRKKFMAPQDYEEKKVLLEFEGVYHNAEVYINGEKAAFRPYGYTNFYVDTKGFLKYGEENEVRVVAHNTDQPNSRWYPGTGLYRPAYLYIGEEKHIPVNGVKIRTVSYQPAMIEVTVKTSVPGEVQIEICDGNKTVLTAKETAKSTEAVFKLEVPNAKLWSCETPNLYTCKAVFGEDTVTETFGIRELKWDAQNGMTINGKRVILRGACIHHDNGLLGACAFPEAEERKVRILQENGYNAIRSAHNPCSKAMLDACDRLGMLMMDEYVDCWYIHKTEYDYVSYLKDWWKADLKDMVDKDYNHPCVIMYSTGNEVAETAQEKGIALTGDFTNYLHSLDPSRPVSCGINIFFNFLSSIGFGVYSDEKAKKEAASSAQNEKGKEKKKPVGSEFYNVLACMLGDYTMKVGATLPPCDWKTKGAYANMDIAGYNYGLFRYKHDLKKYPNRLILGSETFCKDAYSFWEIAKKNNRIIGDFVWAGWDYIGETGIGATEYKDYIDTADASHMTGGNGRIDLLGKPRAEAAYTRVALEQEPGPYIAVLPVYEKEKLRLTGWQFTKAVESWSWRGCAGEQANIEVYARGAQVALLVNGKEVGRKTLKKCKAVFKTVYEDGEITAVSYDEKGKEINRYSMQTAGKDTVLQVTPEVKTVKPDGIVFVQLRYTDAKGIWKPMEKHMLKVTVENGELLGLGSANPYVKGNYTENTTKTYFGEAMAVVRANGNGPLKVMVADKNHSRVAEIPCK